MDKCVTAVILGCFSTLLWHRLPSLASVVLTLVVTGLLCRQYPTQLAKILFCTALGAGWLASVGHWHSYWQLPQRFYQQTVILEGRIESIVTAGPPHQLLLAVARINRRSFSVKPRVKLSWYRSSQTVGAGTVIVTDTEGAAAESEMLRPDSLQQGQKVRLVVRLKPPFGLKNQYGFDFQQWLFSQNIKAIGYVKESTLNQLLLDHSSVRQALVDRIGRFELRHSAWILALGLGYRSLLQKSDWSLLQITGTAHLIAVSGLHLGIVAGFAWVLITALLRVILTLTAVVHCRNYQGIARWSCVVVAGLYGYLAGMAIPTLRAWLMLLILALLLHYRIVLSRFNILQSCLLCFLLLLPLTIFTLSFWLTFTAVLTVIFGLWLWPNAAVQAPLDQQLQESVSLRSRFVTRCRRGGRWGLNALRYQLLFSVLLLPVIAWKMQLISVVSPLVNLIAVPVVTLLLLPMSLLIVILAAISLLAPIVVSWELIQLVLELVDSAFGCGISGLRQVAAWSGAIIELSAIPLSAWGCLWIVAVWMFFPRSYSVPSGLLGLILLLPLATHLASKDQHWQVRVLDVGQGLAVLITRNGRAILYDTGVSFGTGYNMADAVIIPTLKGLGIGQLDLLIVSHGDIDHSGSAQRLIDLGLVEQVMSSQFQPSRPCEQGMAWQWQELAFDVLWPVSSAPVRSQNRGNSDPLLSDNNQSCVVRVSNGEVSFWLTGDIEHLAEAQLTSYLQATMTTNPGLGRPNRGGLSRVIPITPKNVIIVPHHGSRTSSNEGLLAVIQPDVAVFSAGFNNRWGMPHADVIRRYQGINAGIYNTAQDGEIVFTMHEPLASAADLPAVQLDIQRVRSDIKKYWYANIPSVPRDGKF